MMMTIIIYDFKRLKPDIVGYTGESRFPFTIIYMTHENITHMAYISTGKEKRACTN